MKKLSAVLSLLFVLVACAKETEVIENEEVIDEEQIESQDPKSLIDLSLNPNESGEIMVLMYHSILENEDVWIRSIDNFKKDLETLYTLGFRPISLMDYVSGNIQTEQGKTPIVLTFDDGLINNYKILEDGSIDPNSAIGIMIDFHESHPDFPLEASFFLTGTNLFGQSKLIKEKLNHIIELGMDLGNHSVSHPNFSKLTDSSEIQKELGQQIQYIESFLDTDYTVNTMALVYGSSPKTDELKAFMVKGRYEDVEYEHKALLKVGSNPGLSSYHKDFDALAIPRVRASEMDTDGVGLYDYLEMYKKHPERRFISDGNPDIVTVPSASLELIQNDLEKEIYAY